MEGNGGEGEESKEDREALSIHHGSDENDGRLTGQSVDQVDEVKVFVLERDEEIVLKECRYSLISISRR